MRRDDEMPAVAHAIALALGAVLSIVITVDIVREKGMFPNGIIMIVGWPISFAAGGLVCYGCGQLGERLHRITQPVAAGAHEKGGSVLTVEH